jgi:hypothetical protein
MPLGSHEFPDIAVHRICVRCQQWCWPNEGRDYVLPRVSPLAGAATLAGIEQPTHFMCFACRRKRVVLRIWVLVVLAVLVGLAIVYRQFAGA